MPYPNNPSQNKAYFASCRWGKDKACLAKKRAKGKGTRKSGRRK